eukprot:TRINITY_DN3404_c0_g5_i3.p1 TRINITY_DN3404_c0_g5~~TRINITY_DN3404_c0_g5_i3.p1  ORF type:complete len:290 (+),score=23.61 TRINITY_DN3404_c0_g5_i3:124-993(+)
MNRSILSFSDVYDDVLVNIIEFLDLALVACQISRLNTRFHVCTRDPRAWKHLIINSRWLTNNKLIAFQHWNCVNSARFLKCPSVSNQGLIPFFQRTRDSLRHLTLTGCSSNINDTTLYSLATSCPSLLTLDLSMCSSITNDGVCRLVASCPDLQQLYLCCCRNLDDEVCVTLALSCPRLEILDVNAVPELTDAGLGQILTSCRQLKQLNLSANQRISNGLLHVLSREGEALTYVNLSMCQNLSPDAIAMMVTSCGNLRTLDVSCVLNWHQINALKVTLAQMPRAVQVLY